MPAAREQLSRIWHRVRIRCFGLTGPFDTDQGHGWSITGEFGVDISPVLNVTAFGSYLDYSGRSVTGLTAAPPATLTYNDSDFKNWVAGVNATYTVVPGLTIQPEVYYTRNSVSGAEDVSAFQGGIRIKRVF